ncbi:MAG: Thiamine biosynthesis lipoprotein ApbE precursor [Candidatus Omnitrophica bacterium ADurb.Bin205]|nr:MAG: Thiamine biosynthesis lipoprotein ApbE precursor [Candidatus Omnitrophica bacterium ADurb.Bin205]
MSQSEKKMLKKISIVIIIAIIAIIVFYFIRNNSPQQVFYREKRVILGTFVEVTSDDIRAHDIVFNELSRVERLLSKYDPQSEVSRLNQSGKLRVSPETFYVISKAKEFCAQTNGAFDITIGPLMDLWGFTSRKYLLPSGEEIRQALRLVGCDKIILRAKDNMIQFKTRGVKIDLGGIAKGYAVDCAVKKLKEAKIDSCLINAGGQIYCLGGKSSQPWKIAIRDSRERSGVAGYLNLKDKAVATSGNYEQSFKGDKKYYGHIFDPKTGYPKESDIYSSTVIADDSLTADCIATAVFVLGKEEGELMALRFNGIELIIID